MRPSFNISGPCIPGEHYMLPPERRLGHVLDFIEEHKFFTLEVKIRRDTETERDALDPIARYLDHAGLAEGWLVLFDLRKGPSWGEKLFVREVEHEGKRVRIVGC